ncbi:hypothetical protein GB931_00710 [Modestobacter sp. I12A-02628]|uniref:PASTA domain-containing protein n=1 Tax=Goekera deserti TaxID=2497753 RepID=A0A7K3WHL7_9ACTN|nr:hypothetical protein [Goekera deserti]MPQ96465.1 hypothetical protein [Goekera deserti]NDI47220.1 hypothetical protein [Goekera deserti]NEL55379.1 hypothetical protein [Goekera deserti]
MKRPGFWAVVAIVVAIGAAGNAGKDDASTATAPAPTSTVASTSAPAPSTPAPLPPAPTSPVAVAPPTVVPAPTTVAAPVVDFLMPDLVGLDLQTAQNVIQTNGVFLSLSHDLLGSRAQLLDSNWMVCDQNIAAGERVTGEVEGTIDLGVVKREEPCP